MRFQNESRIGWSFSNLLFFLFLFFARFYLSFLSATSWRLLWQKKNERKGNEEKKRRFLGLAEVYGNCKCLLGENVQAFGTYDFPPTFTFHENFSWPLLLALGHCISIWLAIQRYWQSKDRKLCQEERDRRLVERNSLLIEFRSYLSPSSLLLCVGNKYQTSKFLSLLGYFLCWDLVTAEQAIFSYLCLAVTSQH